MSMRGITESDVLRTSHVISAISTGGFEVRQESARSTDIQNIGSRFNQWRKPVTEYGNNDPEWQARLKRSPYIGNIDFTKEDWKEARKTVDAVLELMLIEIKSNAETYEGLCIERYVRQGSSREGLKVIAPDEFDTLLLYHFDGLHLIQKDIERSGKIIPEFCKMTSSKSMETLQQKFPKLYQKGVFKEITRGTVCLSSKALHQQVFQSIIDKSREKVIELSEKLELKKPGQELSFRLDRRMNAPSINLVIQANGKIIDVDVVPGLLLRQDPVPDPDPAHSGKTVDCPVYAVFKWREEASFKDPTKLIDTEVFWRVCSSGYEKHTTDVARCDMQQLYIITALRILKAYFTKTKRSGNNSPPQIVTVLRSYHLKNIAYYVILHTRYVNHVQLKGAMDALGYFLSFLRVSLERKLLPHFFHSNRYITYMYPRYPVKHNALRFNLLGSKSADALDQALHSLKHHLIPDLGFSNGSGDVDQRREQIIAEYSQHISEGSYF